MYNQTTPTLYETTPTLPRPRPLYTRPHPPNHGKGGEFLQIKGEIWSERGLEKSGNCLFILEPNSCKSEEKGSAHGSEEATPVVPHGKVGRRYLYAEKHTCGEGVECVRVWGV